MKKLLTLAFLLATGLCFAQENTGIQFVHNLSWGQIKAKAKAENRYIFVDTYTTWCGPCRQMDKEIFPLKEVGDFYNANFINVKVQIDVTKNDNEEVKAWYQDAKNIAETYKISAFPTYLFLNPQGELVHRFIGEKSSKEFITKGQEALNPHKQYFSLKRQYESGKREPELLLNLISGAFEAQEGEFIPIVAQDYFSTSPNLNQPEVIKLLPIATTRTNDAGFIFLLTHSATADSVLGKGRSLDIVKSLILNEEVIPHLRTGKTKRAGWMIMYTGEPKKEVNWLEVKKDLDLKYPQLSNEIYLKSRTLYFEWNKDFPNFALAMDQYIAEFPQNLSKYELNHFAWLLFEKCDDPKALRSALAWSKKTLEGVTANEIAFMDTYANLLYKTGNKQEAIALETEAIKISKKKNQNSGLHKVLDKMKKGEKTW